MDIDHHWKLKHASVMPYETAWPLIRDGRYDKRDVRNELLA